jgi:antitoxin component YwqK of YwqJK toxin-antitoxin module
MKYKYYIFFLICIILTHGVFGQINDTIIKIVPLPWNKSNNDSVNQDTIIYIYYLNDSINQRVSFNYTNDNHEELIKYVYYDNGQLKSKSIIKPYLNIDSLYTSNELMQNLLIVKQKLVWVNHGVYEELFENGNKKILGQYIMGVKTGTWTYYNQNGDILIIVDE